MKILVGSYENGRYYYERYKEGFVYLDKEGFKNKDNICYIPSLTFEELGDGLTVEDIKKSNNACYTYNDLVELFKGNEQSVKFMLRNISWIHPETFIENLSEIDLGFCEECGQIYDLEVLDECPKCEIKG